MKLEDQVVSLKLANKLKKLGVTQKSFLYWDNDGKGNWQIIVPLFYNSLNAKLEMFKSNKAIAAFTVAELGEMLPSHHTDMIKVKDGWIVRYCEHEHNFFITQEAPTEADARAKMLIYLLENKFIAL